MIFISRQNFACFPPGKLLQAGRQGRASVSAVSQGVFGAIAQLGERLHGMQEVSGSIPLSSTNSPTGFRGRGLIAYSPLLFLCLRGLCFPAAGLGPVARCAAPITILYSLPEVRQRCFSWLLRRYVPAIPAPASLPAFQDYTKNVAALL